MLFCSKFIVRAHNHTNRPIALLEPLKNIRRVMAVCAIRKKSLNFDSSRLFS